MPEPAKEPVNEDAGSKPPAAAEVPPGASSTADAVPLSVDPAGQQDEEDDSRPASPLNMTGMKELLRKPFGDVLKSVAANLPVKSSAHLATEQLKFCLHSDPSHVPELMASPVLSMLTALVKESPGIPAAGSAMVVLEVVALTPDGRARLRAEGMVQPIMRFLSMPGVLQKPNAEHALLLLQNLSCDKHCRQAIMKAEGLALMLDMLAQYGGWLRQHFELANPIAAVLTHLVIGDSDSSSSSSSSSGLTAKQKFVKMGGIEAVCKAIAEWGRTEPPPYVLRLRLLLHEVSHHPLYTTRVQDVALDAGSMSARLAALTGEQRTPRTGASIGSAGSTGVGSLPGSQTAGSLAVSTAGDYVERLGKGVVLGTPRMPASQRIASAVLNSEATGHAVLEPTDEDSAGA